jgi:hypothetical protein
LNKPFKIDFVGIGPPKSGTTWLGHVLQDHPQICMSEPKEVNYFNDSLSFNRSYLKTHYHLGPEWYAKHFRHCGDDKLIGEITPRYILDPVVPQRLKDHNPDVKIIVTLRSPFERIISHYHSAKDFHKSEKRSISVAIREEPEYIGACMYYENLLPFLTCFGLNQIFFLDLEDVKQTPDKVLNELYTFLGVDPDFRPSSMTNKSNPARATKWVALRKLTGKIHRTLIIAGFSRLIIVLKKTGIGKLINRLNSQPIQITSLSDDDKNFIRSKLCDDIAKFSQLRGKDYADWLK